MAVARNTNYAAVMLSVFVDNIINGRPRIPRFGWHGRALWGANEALIVRLRIILAHVHSKTKGDLIYCSTGDQWPLGEKKV